MSQDIYVDVQHANFWWGLYGFTDLTDWEDLQFYEKRAGSFFCIGKVCVCSKSYLEHTLIELQDDPGEKDYLQEIRQFLQDQVLLYRYFYDERDDKDFHEVSFEAQRNAQGVKPSYIEMWYPGDGIDMTAVEKCTLAFCARFLHKQGKNVFLKDPPPFEQTAKKYQKFAALFNESPVQMVLTDDLIKSLAENWKISEEKARKVLMRSI